MVPTKLYKCRLCINEGNDFTSIFDGNNRITRMIKCLPVQIRQNDDLPHHICPSCLNALDVTYSLNILCLKAHLRYLEEPEDTEQDENYHPKIQNDAPTSFLASCGEKPATTSPTINENTCDLKINNEANKWSNILQKIPEVRLSRLSEIFSVQSEIPKDSTKLIKSTVPLKDETYDPDQFEPYDPCPIETKPKAPVRKRGRSRKIVQQNEQSSSARTTGYLPKEKRLIPLESIPVESQTELLVSQVSYVFAMKVMCSQCKQMFAFSALCPDELKRLTEGGVFHCIDCKTGQKQGILSPAEPQVKRLRLNGGNEDASEFTHLTEHNYALRPSTCGLRGSGEQTKEKSFQIQLLKLNKHTLI